MAVYKLQILQHDKTKLSPWIVINNMLYFLTNDIRVHHRTTTYDEYPNPVSYRYDNLLASFDTFAEQSCAIL